MNFNITNNLNTNLIVNGDVQTNLHELRHNVLYLEQSPDSTVITFVAQKDTTTVIELNNKFVVPQNQDPKIQQHKGNVDKYTTYLQTFHLPKRRWDKSTAYL